MARRNRGSSVLKPKKSRCDVLFRLSYNKLTEIKKGYITRILKLKKDTHSTFIFQQHQPFHWHD